MAGVRPVERSCSGGGRLVPRPVKGLLFACAWLVGPVLTSSCTDDPREDAGDGVVASAPAGVRGVVRDAETDRPVTDALVTAADVGARSDEAGTFYLTPLGPGPVVVRAYQRGYTADSATVEATAGGMAEVNLALDPADPPCCELLGEWSGRFTLDSAGIEARPARRVLEGDLSFRAAEPSGRRVTSATGSSGLDFGPLLGVGVRAPVGDLRGLAFHGDSVAITLLPQFGDWAIELRGRLTSDTIRGDWFQRASCCGAYGGFELVRADP